MYLHNFVRSLYTKKIKNNVLIINSITVNHNVIKFSNKILIFYKFVFILVSNWSSFFSLNWPHSQNRYSFTVWQFKAFYKVKQHISKVVKKYYLGTLFVK